MRRAAFIVIAAAVIVAIDGETLARATDRIAAWVGPQDVEVPLLVNAPAEVALEGPVGPLKEIPPPTSEGALPADPLTVLADPLAASTDPESDALPDDLAVDPLAGDPPDVVPAEAPEEAPDVIVSVARETWIYAEPRWRSRRLGYLRAGAVIGRDPEPASRQSCRGGWYRVEPRGYVCLNRAASLDPEHPVAVLSAKRPFMGGLPYLYAMARYPTPPLYAGLPSEKQQRETEPGLAGHLRKIAALARDPDFTAPPDPDPIPPLLADGLLPGLAGQRRTGISLGRARVRSGFAMLASYDHDGRRFGLTTEMALVPLDRMRVVPPSTLRGVALSDEFTLPIAIVTSKRAILYRSHEGNLAGEAPLAHRQVLSLTGVTKRRGGVSYHEVTGGDFVRADQVARIDRFNQAPKWALQGKKWVDVSILRQALVAYEGTRPVYATLVSTGADGLADHEDSHATIQGTFLIHTKHVSVTMDGDDEGDEFDLRDVPFVQYFTEGYALHGAYWHDDFGRPRSHGCINLAPVDAAWLFRWTDPEVPKGWHAALSLKRGTTVYIHP